MDTKELAEYWAAYTDDQITTTESNCIELAAAYLNLQKELEDAIDIIAQCRNAAGFGTASDPMGVEGAAALSEPFEVPVFIYSQFQAAQKDNALLREAGTKLISVVDRTHDVTVWFEHIANLKQVLSSTPTDNETPLLRIYKEASELMAELGANGWHPDKADALMNALYAYDQGNTTDTMLMREDGTPSGVTIAHKKPDMICLSKEELMEPSFGAIGEGVTAGIDVRANNVEVKHIYQAIITQLLKERDNV